MELSCVWIMYIVLLTITIQKTTSVRLLVLRDNVGSASEEDASDTLSEEESEEIDFLMDLIESEAKDRDPPPVTTVRLIKQVAEHTKALPEQVAQHSIRKERVETHPNSFKEYHVHYHNHQHKGPAKPTLGLVDGLTPFVWNSQFPLGDFDTFKQFQKSSLTPYHKEKSFSDFDSFLKTSLRSQFPMGEKIDPKIRLEAFKDFETYVKPRIPMHKSKEEPPYVRMKKFQEYYDSEEEKITSPNQNRFAGFKDFSELESPEKPEEEEKRNQGENQAKKTVKIKDFAIVIKSKPRKPQKIVDENKDSIDDGEEEISGPQIPPFVNKLNIPHDKIFGMPKIIDAAGGAPKYIDALNQLRYPHPDFLNLPLPFPLNLNAVENERLKLHHFRPPFLPPPPVMHPIPHFPRRPHLSGWLIRRLMKS